MSLKIYSLIVDSVKGGAVKVVLYLLFLTSGKIILIFLWFCWVEVTESMVLYIFLINSVCSVYWSHTGSFRDIPHCSREWPQMCIYSALSISVRCEEFNKMDISYPLPMPVKSSIIAKIIYVYWETDYLWSSVIYVLILMPQLLLFTVRCHSWKVHWQMSAVNGLS